MDVEDRESPFGLLGVHHSTDEDNEGEWQFLLLPTNAVFIVSLVPLYNCLFYLL